jgi:hypothetical protein
MRRMAMVTSVLAAAVLVVGLAAQATSFAGKWTLVPDPNAAAGGGGRGGRGGGFGGLGQEATIAQDASTLTVTRTTQAGEIKSVYKLDGSESTNTMNFGGNSVDQKSTAKWDGPKLTITTSSDFGGNQFQTTMTLSLDASGNLTVESSRPDFQGGGAPVVTKMTYKKS